MRYEDKDNVHVILFSLRTEINVGIPSVIAVVRAYITSVEKYHTFCTPEEGIPSMAEIHDQKSQEVGQSQLHDLSLPALCAAPRGERG